MYDTNIKEQEGLTLADDIFPIRKIIIFVFLTLLSCTYLPCAILSVSRTEVPTYFVILAYIVMIAGAVYIMYCMRKYVFAVLSSLLLIFIYSLTSSPLLPATIVAIIVPLAFGGFVCSVCPKKLRALLLLMPITAYLGAFALTGRWVLSLVSVIPTAAALSMGFLQRKNSERKTLIAVSSIILIALMTAVVALMLWERDMLSMQNISNMINTARDELIAYMKDLTVEVGGSTMEVFDAEYVDSYVTYMFNLLPSMLTVVCFAVIYIAHSIQLQMYKSCDLDLMVNTKTSKITVSVYCAAIFIVSYILSLSTDVAGNPDMLSAVCGNLRVILTPALLLVGFDAIGAMLRRMRGFGFFVILLLAVAVFTLSSYIILIISAIGAFYVIIKAIDTWAAKHYSKKNRQG